MKKDIVDIIKEKEFIELTTEERLELTDLCASEEEFYQLKNVFANVDLMASESLIPKQETKDRLDQLFEETYPKTLWYNSVLGVLIPREKPLHRQPLMQMAAVALLLILVVPLFRSTLKVDDKSIAQTEVRAEESVVNQSSETSSEKVENEDLPNADGSVIPDVLPDLVGSTLTVNSQMISELKEAEKGLMELESPVPGSKHPDGIFMGGASSQSIAFSLPASESSELLDLLTVTF